MNDSQKTAVIFGLANKRSIAWAIAKKLHEAGWRLAITYQNERLELEAKDLIAEMPGAAGFMCDVTKDDEIARLFDELKARYGVLHGLIHSVGFAPPEEQILRCGRSEEHTSELQSRLHLVCRLLLEK